MTHTMLVCVLAHVQKPKTYLTKQNSNQSGKGRQSSAIAECQVVTQQHVEGGAGVRVEEEVEEKEKGKQEKTQMIERTL
jgi:hypothetical protein